MNATTTNRRPTMNLPVETRNGSAVLIPMDGGRIVRPSQFSIPLARAARRQGVGTRLFADVVAAARQDFPGARIFRVYAASAGVVKFWEAQGFRITDPNGPLESIVLERPQDSIVLTEK